MSQISPYHCRYPTFLKDFDALILINPNIVTKGSIFAFPSIFYTAKAKMFPMILHSRVFISVEELIGTQKWTEASQDELMITYRSNFHQNSFTEVRINDTCDRPQLRKLDDLSQLTRSGETIERGDPLRRMHVKIPRCRGNVIGVLRR